MTGNGKKANDHQKKRKPRKGKRKANSPLERDSSHFKKFTQANQKEEINKDNTRTDDQIPLDKRAQEYYQASLDYVTAVMNTTPPQLNYSQAGQYPPTPMSQPGPYNTPTPHQNQYNAQYASPQPQAQQYTPGPLTPSSWALCIIEDIQTIKKSVSRIGNIERTVDIINQKVSEVETRVSQLETKINDVELSCNFISDECDKQKTEMEKAKKEMKELRLDRKEIEQKMKQQQK